MVYRQRFNPKPPTSVLLYLLPRPLQRTGALSFRHQCTHWCHLPPRGRLRGVAPSDRLRGVAPSGRVVLRAANQNSHDCRWQSFHNETVSRRLTEGESFGLLPPLQPKTPSLGFAVPSDQTASKNRGSLLPSPVHALVTPPSQREACSEGGWGKHGG